eukprot:Nitzschia sp. Nitz4//scaffold90_size81538//76870//80378//NITZ4_005330-RA/size81538-augustus-gene-0.13-mRNA-1//1//CDS//3329560044//376//frame0
MVCASPLSDSSSPSPALNLTDQDLKGFRRCDYLPTFAPSSKPYAKEPQPSSQTLISKALESLSLEERDRVYDDIHGVDARAEEAEALESPGFLESQLKSFEMELQDIKSRQSGSPELHALEAAEQQDLAFVQNPLLRLPFLRTNDWKAKEAASCFVKYLDLKLILFGPSLLTRQVTIRDLTQEEVSDLSKGYFQVLPYRDRSGRAVLVWMNVGQVYSSVEVMARQLFVMLPMDLETQRRGVSVVSMRIQPFQINNQSTLSALPLLYRLIFDFPIRVSAHHFCMPNAMPGARPFQALLEVVIPIHAPKMRARIRFHYGTFMEWCYDLMTFGLPVQLLPMTADFKVKAKIHKESLDMQIRAASLGSSLDTIVLPTNRDLLIGKGKPIQQSPGNLKWSEFLETLIVNPKSTGPMLYTELAKQVVQHCVNFCSPSSAPLSPNDALNLTSPVSGNLLVSKSTSPVPQGSAELISEALNSLTLEERSHIFDDIHGVDNRAENATSLETPVFLQQKLQDFETELQKLRSDKRNSMLIALVMAEQMSIGYVQDPNLRLAFLRTRDWDCQRAAADFVGHFDLKRLLFGDAKLVKNIDLGDLHPQDLKILRMGHCQVLPSRDRSGRAVTVYIHQGQEYPSFESLARQMYAISSTDEETQLRGMLSISFMISPHRFVNHPTYLASLPLIKRCAKHMPVRNAVFHFCLTGPTLFPGDTGLLEAVVQWLSPEARTRLRFHHGSYTEWCYGLMTFGVPVQLLPLTHDLAIKTKNHSDFLEMMQKAAELKWSSNNSIEPILLPTNRDILLAKGKPYQNSFGNLQLSAFIDKIYSELNPATIPGNPTLAAQIVLHVKEGGGRFVSRDSGVWLVVDDELAKAKVMNMLRHRRLRRSNKAT